MHLQELSKKIFLFVEKPLFRQKRSFILIIIIWKKSLLSLFAPYVITNIRNFLIKNQKSLLFLKILIILMIKIPLILLIIMKNLLICNYWRTWSEVVIIDHQ